MRLAAVAIVLAASPALADTEAERFYNDGQAAYDDKRYDDAIAAWNKSYELSKLPALVFNLAQAHRLANHCDQAVEHYKRFLALDPASAERPTAEQMLRELEPCKKPAPRPFDFTPGPRVETLPSALGSYRIEDRGGGKRTTGLVVGGAGIVLFATGLDFGNRATSIANEIEDTCAMGCEWGPLEDKDASGRRAQTLQYVFYGIGGASIIAGGALYLLGVRAKHTQVMIEPKTGVVGITGRF